MSAPAPCVCEKTELVGASDRAPDTCAVIVAGGAGDRFGDPRGKQFVELCGLPLMCWSLVAHDRAPSVARLVVVCAPERAAEVERDVLSRVVLKKPTTLAAAGATRQESVLAGLRAMPRDLALVAVHDAARPLVETEMIERVISTVRADPALAGAILAARSIDTLKLVEKDTIIATPDRTFYWAAQTPQVFRTQALLFAHRQAVREEYRGTDDASLVERCGGRVRVVECSRDNIKVTVPGDLAIAEAALEQRLVDAGCGRPEEGAL
ncbi:2-C-methyl-D-erythritol 4-phosphate cytidylyltransferase [Thermophilibacter immobilis]|jgi:2-C-methyl-D-erythritol 4-phosphate cytidylyltransferase|uniref:2-C-methyl-D-erythritol 4-phosphate cytidylyltransferase n=1 Tax=Thermophilibacter immobilis TaxID=2779519 RepID=A0A7S7RUD3_9ACTN|nr:2-C-methyl-D-erythritol 4-phosphate cytidylyltransferase [Thermophilibacter immobilis]QOY60510.1 2-C-methyl-D-erythritol 4-phosphate cytidylyltransferase [Thermophilibacter immobilis]